MARVIVLLGLLLPSVQSLGQADQQAQPNAAQTSQTDKSKAADKKQSTKATAANGGKNTSKPRYYTNKEGQRVQSPTKASTAPECSARRSPPQPTARGCTRFRSSRLAATTSPSSSTGSTTMTSLSLNGRSYTDLLSIQPGVIPTTTIQSNSVIMAGVTGPVTPSGGLNPGIVSVSGQRETANGFYVNGSDVQERMNGGTGVVPESRLDRGVPAADEQLRSGIRQLQRRHRQRRHQVGQRHAPRQRVRVLPQHQPRRPQLLLARAGGRSSRTSRAARSAVR